MITVILALSLAVGLAFLVVVRQRPLRRAFAIYEGAWHLPLILYLTLPFTPKFAASPAVVGGALVLVQLVLLPSVLYASRRGRWNTVEPVWRAKLWWDRRRIAVNVVWVYAMSSVLFLAIDFFYFRGLGLLNGIHQNRAIFDGSHPSVFGYLAYLGEGVGLMLLGLAFYVRSKLGKVALCAPYGLLAFILLVAGIRQYVLFGALMMVLAYVISGVGTRRLILTVSLAGLLFGAAMVGYNIVRQPATKGKQVQFVEAIGGFRCSDQSACKESTFAIALNYVYQYFGDEYIGLTAVTKIPTSARPPFTSQTIPVLYRRLQDVSEGLPSYRLTRERRLSEIAAITGSYPNFWKTMYSDAFVEGGWMECVVLALVAAALLLFATIRLNERKTPLASVQFVSVMAALVFGVMYIPTREAFILGLALILFFVRLRLDCGVPRNMRSNSTGDGCQTADVSRGLHRDMYGNKRCNGTESQG